MRHASGDIENNTEPMLHTKWTPKQVENLLQQEKFGYQRIELPYGFATPGRDRIVTARKIFPDDLAGKSVLDLGCNHGYFCFEAIRRGARRVVGYDVEHDIVRKARLLADCLDAPVEFGVRDFERQPIEEEFDYVLCLNVLHHLKNPLATLDNLIRIVKERLVLEIAALGFNDRRRMHLFPLYAYLLSRAPVIYISDDRSTGKQPVEKFFRWFITPKGMRNLLVHHRSSFARVESFRSEHKGRYLVVAEKLRIGHLIVVAEPMSAEDSAFCQGLKRGELPEIARRLDIDPGAPPTVLGPSREDFNVKAGERTVLFQYDFLRPYMTRAKAHSRDEALDVLETADRITFVTLWVPPSAVTERIAEKQRREPSERHSKLERACRDPARVIEFYERWIEFTRDYDARHMIAIKEGGETRLVGVEEWRRMVGPETEKVMS